MDDGRTIVWWSAGVASSVAAKVALAHDANAIVAYCDTSSTEHPDNERFLIDCQRWYGKEIMRLRSSVFLDTWDVYERTRWLVGVNGARCTTELKKNVRRAFQRADDVQAFGFTADEPRRAERFRAHNPECNAWFPLIERGLKHADCEALLREMGIELPAMYRLGYRNNNCIGCVKGGAGYWNKIRTDFPEVFARMAKLERALDVAILKRQVRKKRVRVFLDQLDPSSGDYAAEPAIECGLACGTTLAEIDATPIEPQPTDRDRLRRLAAAVRAYASRRGLSGDWETWDALRAELEAVEREVERE